MVAAEWVKVYAGVPLMVVSASSDSRRGAKAKGLNAGIWYDGRALNSAPGFTERTVGKCDCGGGVENLCR
jgi:uncharacterized protein YodC (DUF2158 family)